MLTSLHLEAFGDLILLLCVLKKFWCQLPEDDEVIKPKHVVAVEKIVRINYTRAG